MPNSKSKSSWSCKTCSRYQKNRLRNLYYLGQVRAINKSNAVIEFDMNGTILDANENF